MKRERIVVIEDEPDIREIIEHNLTREGYRVKSSGHGDDALRLAQEERADLMLLDLMLPGLDGLEICRQIKGNPDTQHVRIIMVTAKGEESDIVIGLGMGADDYVTKPFSPKELIARTKAVLRRGRLRADTEKPARLQIDGVCIDPERHEVLVDGGQVIFTATEFRLLHYLASRAGRVFTRDQLIGKVIGEDVIVGGRNIDVHVKAVRMKLGSHRDLIETIRGVGYRFRDERG